MFFYRPIMTPVEIDGIPRKGVAKKLARVGTTKKR